MNRLLYASVICFAITGCNREPGSQTSASDVDNSATKINFLAVSSPVAKNISSADVDNNDEMDDIQDSQDWELSSRVEDIIMSDHSITENNRNITITAENGVVTLSGTVTSKLQRNKILKRVRNIQGVESVDNQLIVSRD